MAPAASVGAVTFVIPFIVMSGVGVGLLNRLDRLAGRPRGGVATVAAAEFASSTFPASIGLMNAPATKRSRNTNFWILPEPVSGQLFTVIQRAGVFCGARWVRRWATQGKFDRARLPGASRRKQITISPQRSSGAPITATLGHVRVLKEHVLDLSWEEEFSPPRMIISFTRAGHQRT